MIRYYLKQIFQNYTLSQYGKSKYFNKFRLYFFKTCTRTTQANLKPFAPL